MLYKHTGSIQKVNSTAGLFPEVENSLPLPAAWGLRAHHQTMLPNIGSASSPLAEVEDM